MFKRRRKKKKDAPDVMEQCMEQCVEMVRSSGDGIQKNIDGYTVEIAALIDGLDNQIKGVNAKYSSQIRKLEKEITSFKSSIDTLHAKLDGVLQQQSITVDVVHHSKFNSEEGDVMFDSLLEETKNQAADIVDLETEIDRLESIKDVK